MSGHTCLERLLLPEALTGRLQPSEEKRVMAHLQTCAACRSAADDIEVSLISLAVLKDERAHPSLTAPTEHVDEPVEVLRPARRRPIRLLAVAAAVLLLAGGIAVGRLLLPPREAMDFGPAMALSPPATAPDQATRGTVAVAPEGNALAVRLNATSLPAAGWYECVWVASGESRSAGSFRAANGVVKDVVLRVAPPQDTRSWDLQLIAHRGDTSQVVLQGSASYHP